MDAWSCKELRDYLSNNAIPGREQARLRGKGAMLALIRQYQNGFRVISHSDVKRIARRLHIEVARQPTHMLQQRIEAVLSQNSTILNSLPVEDLRDLLQMFKLEPPTRYDAATIRSTLVRFVQRKHLPLRKRPRLVEGEFFYY
jgi:hypothetical protein